MSSEEQKRFQLDPLFKQKILLRQCDDLAKSPHARVPELHAYWDMVVNHLCHNV